MKDKRIYIVLLFILFSFAGNAQRYRSRCDSCAEYDNGFTYSFGVSFQRHVDPELGIAYSEVLRRMNYQTHIFTLPKFSTEFYLANKQAYLAPKLSYEMSWLYFGGRVNLIDYTNFKLNDYRFTPEIGICLNGALDIFYGYNIPIGNERITNVVPNRITIDINVTGRVYY